MRNPVLRTAALAGACAVLINAGAATARPIFVKLPDIEGESPENASDDHKEWIDVLSVGMAGEARSGVKVAAGDVTGDGRAEAEDGSRSSGHGAGAGKVQMAQPQGRQGDQAPVRGVAAPGPDPVSVGLLLPAVQKARIMVVERQGHACAVGRPLGAVEIREEPGGKTGRILDATVSHCSAEQISLNFTKIEWD